MLQKIISFSVRNKLVIGLFVFALVAWGVFETTRLPIDALPDITDNQVQVITVSPSLGAPDIERLVTFPVEQACSNIPGLKQVRSFSRFGLSLVTIVFDEQTDVYWARQQIAERLQQVRQQIPDGVGFPEMAPVTTGLGEIYQYIVRPEKGYESRYDAMELRTIQDWIVRRQLLGTSGVAEVSSFGGKLKQYEIAVRQENLKSHGLTISDIFTALEQNNENTGGAYIEKGPTVLYIRSKGLAASIEDLRNIVVKNVENGVPVLLSDVADVQLGSAIRYGAMTYNDKGEVAGAVVMMLKGANSSEVVASVKKRIAEIGKMLPEGVVIEPFIDRTKMVNNAISTVETNLVEGALIVIFVLVFFLGNLRAGLIVSSVIPLSMLFAIILMNLTGVGGNLMSLGAIDFGLIVDGSVIVIEVILHRFSHSKHFAGITRLSRRQMDDEVTVSTGSMIKSAVFSQIIILIVYLPILSLQGIEGKMFKPMAFTIAYAIFGAFLLSVTYVPMMAALCLNRTISHKKTITDRLMAWLERRYRPLLRRVLGFSKTVIAVAILLFGISVVVLSGMGGEFIPQLEEGDFAVETRLLTGSNLNNTIHSTQQASKILLERFPEVEKIVTKIGSAEVPTDPMPFEAGDMMVILKDKKEWTSAATFPELSEKMAKELEEVPGITVGFQFPVQMRFNELMTGARQDIVCKIYGENLDTLSACASRLARLISTVKGAVNIYEEKVTGMPQVVIKYDRRQMAILGLSVKDVNNVVNTAFAGQIAGQVYEGEKRFDIAVRLNEEARKNIHDIRNLMIASPNGEQVPLSAIAEVSETAGVNQIQRENTKRRIIVGFNVNGRDVQSVVREVQEKAAARLSLPKTYTIEYGGSFENMTAAKERLSIVVPVALLMIFLLLYFAFGSVKQGLLIYTAIPLSATGGIFALWLRDMPFSISGGVGFIALFGVAVLNGILLVSEFNRLRKEGWTDLKRIVMHGTQSKLRAVLMTALVPSLGFIPMAVSTGAGGEVQKPLATVVIGGLIISTMLSLFVIPVLYIVFEKGFRYLKPRKAAVLSITILACCNAYSQQPISLRNAIDSVLANSPAIRSLNAEVKAYSQLERTSFDPDQASVLLEYGKFNSLSNDNKISVVQSIRFPTVYSNQRKVNAAITEASKINLLSRELYLKTEVKRLFYNICLLKEKEKLLVSVDSIYGEFLNRALQRLESGQADVLEKLTAENQKIRIAAQLQALRTALLTELNTFNSLLNSKEYYQPESAVFVYDLAAVPDTSALSSSPRYLLAEKQLSLTQNRARLEKSLLLPSLTAGFSSTTIIGWQTPGANGTDLYFGRDHRFSSVSLGVGVPLFYGAQKNRIRAAKFMTEQQEWELEATRIEMKTAIQNARSEYLRNSELAAVYKEKMLPSVSLIYRAADARLDAGEIGYLEWVLLVNQATEINSGYLEAIERKNESAVALERLAPAN